MRDKAMHDADTPRRPTARPAVAPQPLSVPVTGASHGFGILSPGLVSPEALLGMQRTTGNAAVSGALAASGVTVQRRDENADPPTPEASERTKIDDALKPNADASDVKEIKDFSAAKPDELLKLAHTLVYKYSLFFGPNDRGTLVKIYRAMGGDIKKLVLKDPFMFQKCMEEWPGTMEEVQPVKEAGDKFKAAISARGKKNLDDNIAYLKAEQKRIMGKEGATPEQTLQSSKEQGDRAKAMVAVAGEMFTLRDKQDEMLKVKVGFAYGESGLFGAEPVLFNPAGPPSQKEVEAGGKVPKWSDLKEQWDLSLEETGRAASKYPWLFGLLKDKENGKQRLKELSETKDPNQARAAIYGEVQKQQNLADRVKEDWAKDEPDWYDLVPVRDQIAQTLDPFEFVVAKGPIAKHKRDDWWKEFAIDRAVDAALIVSAFATAGAAPLVAGIIAGVVATGIPAAEAYAAFAKEKKLDQMNRATVLPDADLVLEMQVDAEHAKAVSKTIMAALNLLMAGAELTAALRLEMQLGRLASLEPGVARTALSKAVMQYGGVGTANRTGLSLTEIMAKLGGEQSEAEALAKLRKEMAELAAKPAAELTAEQRGALRFASAGETALLNLDGLSPTQQVTAILKSIDRDGVAAAVRASRRTPEELLAIVGKDTSAGDRIAAFITATKGGLGAAMDDIAAKLMNFAALDATEANAVILQGIELAGPARTLQRAGGWAAVQAKLGSGAPAMIRLRGWRDRLLENLATFMAERPVPPAAAEAGAKAGAEEALPKTLTPEELEAERRYLALQTELGESEVERVLSVSLDNPDFIKRHAASAIAIKGLFSRPMPLAVRRQALADLMNARLAEAGVPTIKNVTTAAGKNGAHFSWFAIDKTPGWAAEFNETVLLLDVVPESDWQFLVEATYHEAAHADQVFMAARAKAGLEGNIEALTRHMDSGGMGLPQEIAEAAYQQRVPPGSPAAEQGMKYYEAIFGKTQPFREGALTLKKNLQAELGAASSKLKMITGMYTRHLKNLKAAGKVASDPELAAHLADASKRCDSLRRQVAALGEIYHGLDEERDAYRLGEAARQEYLALEREFQELQRRERAAEAAAKGGPPLSDDAPPTVREPKPGGAT